MLRADGSRLQVADLLWLDGLDAAFPDARFVMTYRDPTEVLLSVAGVYADVGGAFTDEIDRGDDRFSDIDFRALQSEPIAEVTGLDSEQIRPMFAEYVTRSRSWTAH